MSTRLIVTTALAIPALVSGVVTARSLERILAARNTSVDRRARREACPQILNPALNDDATGERLDDVLDPRDLTGAEWRRGAPHLDDGDEVAEDDRGDHRHAERG